MPSLSHEAWVFLLRQRPSLVPRLLSEALGVPLPPYTQAVIESADFSQLVPTSYQADLVVLLLDDIPVFAIVVEVQLSPEGRKLFTWPLYATALRAQFECPVVLLVITPDQRVASWASQPIPTGPGSWFLPWVLGPQGVPVVTDPERARQEPELSVLSAMAHGKGDVETAVSIALAATQGILGLEGKDRDLFVLYSDLVRTALSEAARKAFSMFPADYQFQDPLIRESIEKGRLKGLSQGHFETKVSAILAILDARGIAIDESQRQRIAECDDLPTLDRTIRRAATIANAQELFE